ncbi:MAG: FecR domain-containing protein [Porticoccaceae bacterium]|nr:FecR domain-containing protein [Porticoccaceae bacterium]
MKRTLFARMQRKHRAARQVADLYSGHMSESQADDIAQWRQQSQQYQQDFLDVCHGLAEMEELQYDPDIAAFIEQAESQSAVRQPVQHRWTVAASLVVAVAAVFGLFQWDSGSVSEPAGLRYVSGIGEQKTVKLEDGSVVTLNTGTELLVSMSDNVRSLELRRGEAYFDVAKDPQRPFSVQLDERSVTALGTEFNIYRTPQNYTIAVLEGEVSLHKSEQPVLSDAPLISASGKESTHIQEPVQHRIKAGWVAKFDLADKQLTGYPADNIERLQSWRSGQLRFDEKPLSDVIHQLNRYSAKKILIEDAAIMDLKIYAVVRIDRIDLALTSLEKTQPVKVVRHFDRTILVGRDAEK